MTKKEEIKNLYQRLRDVMLEVKGINKDKDKKVNGQYGFVSHDAVSGRLHEPLARNGIVMIPSLSELVQEGNRTSAKMDITFINVDDPKDSMTVTYWGYGIDQQDKGIGKAISYAVKYCLLKTFCLETGDDVEKDNIDFKPEIDEQKVLSERQITVEEHELLELYLQNNKDLRDKILKVIKDRYDISSLQFMPYKAYKQALQSAKMQYQQSVRHEEEEIAQ